VLRPLIGIIYHLAVGCSVALYALALLPRTLVLILTVNAVSHWTSPARDELMRSKQPRSPQSLRMTVIGREHFASTRSRSGSRWPRCSQMAARPVRDVFPATDTSHGNDPYMHNSTGSRQVTWNQTEGRKGVVVLAYSEDDIRGALWVGVTIRHVLGWIERLIESSLTFRLLMSYIYIYMEHPFLMFLDHTQRRTTVGRTLDE